MARTVATLAALCLVLACSSRREPGPPTPGRPPPPAAAGTGPAAEPAPEAAPAPGEAAAPRPPRGPAGPAVAVSRTCELPMWPDEGRVRTERALEYSRPGGRPLLLDLARPASGGPHPLVVAIHGGSWQHGDRSAKDDLVHRLANVGYAAASLDYRLVQGGRDTFPAQAQDVRCAIRFLRENAARFSIDPERLAVTGESAGGHLALLAALAADEPAFDGPCGASAPARVRAVAAFSAPTDMRPGSPFARLQAEELRALFGGAGGRLAELASPLAHADSGDPPVLLVHGRDDEAVPVESSRQLHRRLGELGVPSTLVELPGVGHDFEELNDGAHLRPSMCTFLAFLEATLGP